MPFETVRDQLRVSAGLRRQLAHRYATLASLSDDVQQSMMLRTLGEQERELASGLEEYAADEHDPALDVWIQNPIRPPALPDTPDGDLSSLVAAASAADDHIAHVLAPLDGSATRTLASLRQQLEEVRRARSRARGRIVALAISES